MTISVIMGQCEALKSTHLFINKKTNSFSPCRGSPHPPSFSKPSKHPAFIHVVRLNLQGVLWRVMYKLFFLIKNLEFLF